MNDRQVAAQFVHELKKYIVAVINDHGGYGTYELINVEQDFINYLASEDAPDASIVSSKT